MTTLEIMGQNAKAASRVLMNAGAKKDSALLAIADALRANADKIIEANNIDIENGRAAGLTESLIDRLMLDKGRIDGMAKGVDLWAGKIIIDLRDNGLPVRLVAACPYEGFGKGWDPEWKSLFQEIVEKSDLVEYVCKSYNKGCFMARNKWMVDHSDLVISVFTGEKGGTKNTIDYASKQGVSIRYI